MSQSDEPPIGAIVWRDLTVADADAIRRFYCDVVGWISAPHDMGGYHDFDIRDVSGQTVAGICHARGDNASLPAQWLIYIRVADVEASAQRCTALGGDILDGPRMMGSNRFCVIRDPAGAVTALIEA
ncbi:MAG: VOC family protein [Phycisphaerae bacterium]|nr:VOC family protein [Phycisphaerae bacterium]NUQ47400.1 VOC family protein [Phycisphaerae bacterium]